MDSLPLTNAEAKYIFIKLFVLSEHAIQSCPLTENLNALLMNCTCFPVLKHFLSSYISFHKISSHWIGRCPVLRGLFRLWDRSVVKVIEKDMLSLSIPLRFLSLDIYCTNAISRKELRTSHIIRKKDGKSIPWARQILTAVMATDGTARIYISLSGHCTHARVHWTHPVL